MNRLLAVFTAGAMTFGASAFAEDTTTPSPVTGEVTLDIAETASGDWGGTLGVDVDIAAAGVSLGFGAEEGGDLNLDTWTVGTDMANMSVAIGNDNGAFVGAEGEQTLANPAMTESILIGTGPMSVALGFTDWNSDITDISNIQGSYNLGDITVAGDYNMDSENTVLGAEYAGLGLGIATLGGAVTYDMDAEMFAYEGVLTNGGITGYVNGDQDDALQNIGGGYEWTWSGATLDAGAVYNMDDEDLTPTVSIGFSF